MDLHSKKRTYFESQGSEDNEPQYMRDRSSSPPDYSSLESSSASENLKPSIPLHLLPLSYILGSGVSVDLLQKLYSIANGNTEVAVNKYFEGSIKEDFVKYDVPKESKSNRIERSTLPQHNQRPDNGKAQWERKYIGEIMAQGWASCTTKLLIHAGSRVCIERQYTVSTQNKKASNFSKKSPHKNIIVRFTTLDGKEVGRLPAEIAKYVSKLLDFGCIELEGTVVACQEVIKTGDDILLQLRCFLTKRCFLAGVETLGRIKTGRLSTIDTYFGSIHKPIFDKSAETDAERLLNEKKIAMLALLKGVGVKPIRRGTGVSVDIENKYRDIAAVTELTTTDKKKIGYGAGGSSSIGTSEEIIDEEEEKEIPDEQLDELYRKAQKLDEMLEEKEPSSLLSLELRGYQKQALSWMMEKETNLEDRKKASLHPLWEEYAFPYDPEMSSFRIDEDEELFYLNPYSGEMDLKFQSADSQCRGGILADEMGLGKTIEICALIQTNRPETFDSISDNLEHAENESPTTLIVCPMSLLAQWRDECIRASEPNTTNIDVYYGGNKDRALRDSCCQWNGRAPDILITSYGTVMSEWIQIVSEKTSKGEAIELLTEGDTPKKGLFGINFWRVVLDEAHSIKNRNSKTAKACYALNAERRWVVTGTPIQNKLEDLFSLVHFLRFQPWSNYSFWRTFITVPFEQKDAKALEVMQTVLEPLVLRRTKAMKGPNGVPLVELPEKVIDIEYLSFKDEEQDIYDSLFEGAKTKFSYYVGAGKVLSNYANIFQLLMRLRQVCDHPYLILENKMAVTENLTSKNGQLSLEELIVKFASTVDSKSFGANVMRKLMNGDEDPHKECPVCFENIESPVLTPCMHMVCRACVLDYLQKREHQGEEGECPVCRRGPLTEGDLVGVAKKRRSFIEEDDNLLINDTEDDADAGPSQKRAVDLRYDTFRSSTKLDALLKHLIALRRGSPKIKSVVFSQFTTFLDLIEIVLKRDDFSFVRLDGTMDQAKRERVLREFRDGSATVMLVSLKAGGVGLNLTSASWVFMMDCWWNFAVEAQAIDRVHRIGQKNKVVVKRFIIKGSVEEKILQIQERKNVLASGVGIRRDEARLQRVEELKLLFGEKEI